MLRLSRELVKSVVPGSVAWGSPGPLQLSLGGCPWRVAVGSMLLCRTRRVQAEPVLRKLLARYPVPELLCRAEDIEEIVRPCGLYRNRARQLVRFSSLWLSDGWEEMRELPGVGIYVADAVGLFCFGDTELECVDEVLVEYVSWLSQRSAS